MDFEVEYSGERLELELPDAGLVGHWRGPAGLPLDSFRNAAREAFERPRNYPPLRQAVVPGDRVAIPLSAGIPALGPLLEIIADVLGRSGVSRDAICVLATEDPRQSDPSAIPPGLAFARHDPTDRAGLAYLSATSAGRRIYLNRHVTDADFVLPIGRLGFEERLGYQGPWSVLFPRMSDEAARGDRRGDRPTRQQQELGLAESAEVGWLLGCQFQVGILAGASAAAGILAGRDEDVRREGIASVEASWTFRVDEEADLVIAGISADGFPGGWEELSIALAAASSLVRPGGKIALLSRVAGEPGDALRRLAEASSRDEGFASLRVGEGEPDYRAARRIAEALARSDVYLLSDLEPDFLEDLGVVSLARPEEVRRLSRTAASWTVVNRAELIRPIVGATPAGGSPLKA
jgi:hypothetical protein